MKETPSSTETNDGLLNKGQLYEIYHSIFPEENNSSHKGLVYQEWASRNSLTVPNKLMSIKVLFAGENSHHTGSKYKDH